MQVLTHTHTYTQTNRPGLIWVLGDKMDGLFDFQELFFFLFNDLTNYKNNKTNERKKHFYKNKTLNALKILS